MNTTAPTISPAAINLWEKLQKAEERARAIDNMRTANELRWDKLKTDLETNHPEAWAELCDGAGISRHYNYGDVIC